MQANDSKKQVAIAVPLSNRPGFSKDEEISLSHLEFFLKPYDRFFVLPEHLEQKRDGFGEKRFPAEFFGSVAAHRKLLFLRDFYQSFADYQYVLVYHLDALVFSDQLIEWCEKDFDYIAPPWVKHESAPYAGNAEYEGKVGNGGFSLRKIDSFLKVINSRRLSSGPVSAIKSAIRFGTSIRKYSAILKFFLYCFSKYNGVKHEMGSYFQNEDHFWANRATHYYPAFRVAPSDVALKFAFECVPSYCFELNGKKLPFGCHAWNRYDRPFYEPFLIRT
jgi:hypothetical protein